MKFFFNILELYIGLFLVLILVLSSAFFYNKMINYTKTQSFRALNRFSNNLSQEIREQQSLFEYIIKYRLFDKADILTYVRDFVACDDKGIIVEVIKQPPVSVFFKGYEIDESEMAQFRIAGRTNAPAIYGPYYSSLAGEDTISFIYKAGSLYYIADIDITLLFDRMLEDNFNFEDVALVTTPEGFTVYRSSSIYTSPAIDSDKQTEIIGGKRYFHYTIYNKELRHMIHLLRPYAQMLNVFQTFNTIAVVLLVLWALSYFVRMDRRNAMLWKPLDDLRGKIYTRDPASLSESIPRSGSEIEELRHEIRQMMEAMLSQCRLNTEKRQFYETILDASSNMLFATDENDRIVFVNKAGREFFARDFSDGEDSSDILQLSDQEKQVLSRWKESGEKTMQIHEKRYLSVNGECYFSIVVGKTADNSAVTGYFYTITDITTRKMITDNQWQNRKMETLSILAGGFAHDFNNLMTIILGNLDVYDYIKDEERRGEIIQSMKEAAVKASGLVKQILMFSKQDKMTIQSHIIEDMIGRILKMGQKSMPKNIRMIPNIRTENTTVLADGNQFLEIFLNLIMNARDAILRKNASMESSDGFVGRIEISTELIYIDRSQAEQLSISEGQFIKLCVSDDGIGIPPEIKHLVFDPFFTTKARSTEKGVGLGLSVAYSIVKNFKGAIEIQSLPDVGTNINIYLPVASDEAGASELVFPDAGSRTGKILLIDDDEDILDLGEQFLLLSGFEVYKAKDGKEAVNLVMNNEFVLAIVDMIMPDYDGWYFLDFLQSQGSTLPVIATTGFFESIDAVKLKGYPFIRGLLDKPFTLDKLMDEIGKIVNGEDGNNGKE